MSDFVASAGPLGTSRGQQLRTIGGEPWVRCFAVSRAGVGVHNRRILLVELNKWSPTLRMTLECRHTACIHVSQAGLWIHPWETRPHDLQVVSRHLTTCCLQMKTSSSKSKWPFFCDSLRTLHFPAAYDKHGSFPTI